jgi:hypothetical protein
MPARADHIEPPLIPIPIYDLAFQLHVISSIDSMRAIEKPVEFGGRVDRLDGIENASNDIMSAGCLSPAQHAAHLQRGRCLIRGCVAD